MSGRPVEWKLSLEALGEALEKDSAGPADWVHALHANAGCYQRIIVRRRRLPIVIGFSAAARAILCRE